MHLLISLLFQLKYVVNRYTILKDTIIFIYIYILFSDIYGFKIVGFLLYYRMFISIYQ